jgi:hypothetical protein
MTSFPHWSYFPRNVRAPEWVVPLADVVASAQAVISTVAGGRLESNDVLVALAPGLSCLGYTVEKGKRAEDKISRPVLFGEGGAAQVTMEVDAFHEALGIAVEVEAGRAWNGNAVYRDVVRASLLLDARHLVLMVPAAYSPPSAARPIPAYANTVALLDAIFASGRLGLPFDGVLVLGY